MGVVGAVLFRSASLTISMRGEGVLQDIRRCGLLVSVVDATSSRRGLSALLSRLATAGSGDVAILIGRDVPSMLLGDSSETLWCLSQAFGSSLAFGSSNTSPVCVVKRSGILTCSPATRLKTVEDG